MRLRQWMPVPVLLLASMGVIGCSGWNLQRFNAHPDDDWRMSGHDPQRTWNAGRDLPPPLQLMWKYDASAATGSPAIGDSVMFVGTYKGELHAVRISDGNRLGRISLEGALYATPIIDRSTLYVALASGENTLEAIDGREGGVLWQKHLGPIEASPAKFGPRLFVAAIDGTVYCIDSETGDEVWKHTPPESKKGKRIHSSPATDGTILVFGSDDGTLTALDAATGKLLWAFQTGASIFGSPALDSKCVVVGSVDRMLYAINADDGTLRWKSDFGGSIYSSPAIADSIVVIGAANGCIRALSLASGALRWEYTVSGVVDAPGVICGSTIYIGELDRRITGLRLRDGTAVWSDSVEGRIKTPPIAWKDMIFVPVEDRYIYAYRVRR